MPICKVFYLCFTNNVLENSNLLALGSSVMVQEVDVHREQCILKTYEYSSLFLVF